MSENPKDTHFVNFARLVIKDLREVYALRMDIVLPELETLISRRAHDLVEHALTNLEVYNFETCEKRSDLVSTIPDLPELPKE